MADRIQEIFAPKQMSAGEVNSVHSVRLDIEAGVVEHF
jgi:hypothetical protein